MIGDAAVVAWRIRKLPIRSIDILVREEIPIRDATECSVYETPNGWKADVWVYPDEPIEALDFRFCRGIPVIVHADLDDVGMEVFEKATEAGAAGVSLLSPSWFLQLKGGEAIEWAI